MTDTSSENLQFIAESAKQFAETHIRPFMMDWDETQHFPTDLFPKLGEMGFAGVLVPEEYGGSGLGYQEYITVIEEIAKVCSSIGLSVAAHNSLCTGHILAFGNEEQDHQSGSARHHEHEHHHHDANRHSERIRAHCFSFEAPVQEQAFEHWLELMAAMRGERLLRVKGLVRLAERPDEPLVVHGAQHVFHPPRRLAAWPSDDHCTRLVFVTQDLARAEIERTFHKFVGVDAGPFTTRRSS